MEDWKRARREAPDIGHGYTAGNGGGGCACTGLTPLDSSAGRTAPCRADAVMSLCRSLDAKSVGFRRARGATYALGWINGRNSVVWPKTQGPRRARRAYGDTLGPTLALGSLLRVIGPIVPLGIIAAGELILMGNKVGRPR